MILISIFPYHFFNYRKLIRDFDPTFCQFPTLRLFMHRQLACVEIDPVASDHCSDVVCWRKLPCPLTQSALCAASDILSLYLTVYGKITYLHFCRVQMAHSCTRSKKDLRKFSIQRHLCTARLQYRKVRKLSLHLGRPTQHGAAFEEGRYPAAMNCANIVLSRSNSSRVEFD